MAALHASLCRYVRRQILRRRDEVASGSAGLTSADDSETDAVRCCGVGGHLGSAVGSRLTRCCHPGL